jgi:hypothetical protein
MAKGKNRLKLMADKRTAKARKMANPGYKSNYGKKAAYLKKYGGMGFDYIIKPWRSS